MDLGALSIYQLRVLTAIVEHGSFSEAANALNLTQPAVSAQISRLRKLSHDGILVREGRRFALTEVGRTLFRYAEEVLGATDAVTQRLEDLAAGEQDHVTIEGPLSCVAYVLPFPLSKFKLIHPDLHVSIKEAPGREVIERVRAGRVDMGVMSSAILNERLAENLSVGRLFTDQVVVVEGAEAPFSSGKPMSLQTLSSTPFVGVALGDMRMGSGLNTHLEAAGCRPITPTMEFSTWAGTIQAARMEVGAAVVLRSVVRSELAEGELRVIDVESYSPAMFGVDLICSPERRGDRRTRLFDELLAYLLEEVPQVVNRAVA